VAVLPIQHCFYAELKQTLELVVKDVGFERVTFSARQLVQAIVLPRELGRR